MPYNWSKRMVIVRGLPGSGKSTLATDMFHNHYFDRYSHVDFLVEADNYRMVGGEYIYDEDQNFLAHSWCCSEAFRRLQRQDIIFVANVFSKKEYILPYLEIANKLQIRVLLVEASTPWSKDTEELSKKNTHSVPIEIIKSMMDDWEELSQSEVESIVGHPWES